MLWLIGFQSSSSEKMLGVQSQNHTQQSRVCVQQLGNKTVNAFNIFLTIYSGHASHPDNTFSEYLYESDNHNNNKYHYMHKYHQSTWSEYDSIASISRGVQHRYRERYTNTAKCYYEFIGLGNESSHQWRHP